MYSFEKIFSINNEGSAIYHTHKCDCSTLLCRNIRSAYQYGGYDKCTDKEEGAGLKGRLLLTSRKAVKNYGKLDKYLNTTTAFTNLFHSLNNTQICIYCIPCGGKPQCISSNVIWVLKLSIESL